MSRYINADKLILSLRECAGYEHNKHTTTTWADACESFIDEIEDFLVDDKNEVVPVVHAKWKVCGIFDDFLKCSKCEWDAPITTIYDLKINYCPNCGAKMDGDGNEDKEATNDTDKG